MTKKTWIAAGLLACGMLSAQEKGNPIFSDDFGTEETFIENWKSSSGVENKDGELTLPLGGNLIMKRAMPKQFYATVRLKIHQPEPDQPKGGFGGFTIGGNVFVIRPDGNAWMVYKVPGQKHAGGAIKKIDDFQFGKYYTLTLIRKPAGADKDGSRWIYLVDGKEIGQVVLADPPEDTKLSIFAYRTKLTLDDFQISELKSSDK